MDVESNTYQGEPERHADVYVFCVHGHREQESIDPLDLAQWKFYVVSTVRLNESAPTQKKITIGSLIQRFAPAQPSFKELAQAVREAVKA